MLGNERMGPTLVYTRMIAPYGSVGSGIYSDIAAFIDRCADRIAGSGQEAAAKLMRETKGTPEFRNELTQLTEQMGAGAAQVVQARSTQFYSVAEESKDSIVVGAAKKTASVSQSPRVRAEIYRMTMEFKRKVDEVANSMATGSQMAPRGADQAPQQNIQLVGRVWVG